MVPWWTLIIPSAIAFVLWLEYKAVKNDRNLALNTMQLVETEYRLMAQNVGLFKYVEEAHNELKSELETAIQNLMGGEAKTDKGC